MLNSSGSQRSRLVAAGLLLPVLVAAALAAFAWPSARLAPRDLPVGVAGRAQAAFEQRLAQRGDAFSVRHYADETAARAGIENREIYGALVGSANGVTLLTASAASPIVAQVLEDAFSSAGQARVIDVVPADADDPRGVAFNSLALPLTLIGVIVGLIAATFARSAPGRVAVVAGGAAVAALVAIGIAQGWLGIIGGDWWRNGVALALVVLAIGSLVAGLTALLGQRGVALAAVLLVFFGNPWSGIPTAPELLPHWVGLTGQLLPPGAGGSLLRSTAFFDGSGSGPPVAVLLVWTGLGGAAGALATLRDRHAGKGGHVDERD